jgi:8-oxo-dGTP diphosphatase
VIVEFGEALPGVAYKERPGGYAFLKNKRGDFAVVRTPAGYFLPGGGADAGETPEQALRRELLEEIGYALVRAQLVCQANQYHWSQFYQEHFKKIGYFFEVEAKAPKTPRLQDEHELLWLARSEALEALTQEFQRWALARAP